MSTSTLSYPSSVTTNDIEDLYDDEFRFQPVSKKQRRSLLVPEPLCDPSYDSFTELFPVPSIDQPIYDAYLKHKSMEWSHLHVDMSRDQTHWSGKKVVMINNERHEEDLINSNEKFFLKNTLAYFLVGDFEVNDNEDTKLSQITNPWYRIFLNDKINREHVHNLSYNLMTLGLMSLPSERRQVRESIIDSEVIQDKLKWLRQFIKSDSLAHKEIGGCGTEGIFFSSSFASIYFFKKERELLPGICSYNEYISKDEKLHVEVAASIYRTRIHNKLPRDELLEMLCQAAEIEIRFATQGLPVDLIGMKKEKMHTYIQYCVDWNWMLLTGDEEGIYNVENPFDFMSFMSVPVVADFFNERINTYSRSAGLASSTSAMKFSGDEDF